MFKRKAPLLLQDPTVGAVARDVGRSPAQVYSTAYFRPRAIMPLHDLPWDADIMKCELGSCCRHTVCHP